MAPEELLELNQQKAAGEVEEEELATYVEPTSEAVLMRGLFRGSMWAQGAVALEDEWLDFGAGSRLRIGEQVFGQCLILFRSGTARARLTSAFGLRRSALSTGCRCSSHDSLCRMTPEHRPHAASL